MGYRPKSGVTIVAPVSRRNMHTAPAISGCGSCNACCTIFEIEELGKPAGVPCHHLTAEGQCGIYDDRPDVCREFRCEWLKAGNSMSPKLRPDRAGFMMDTAHIVSFTETKPMMFHRLSGKVVRRVARKTAEKIIKSLGFVIVWYELNKHGKLQQLRTETRRSNQRGGKA